MTQDADARRALADVPGLPAGVPRIARLEGGLTNASFRVDYDTRSYVLRLRAPERRADARNADVEWRVQRRAAEQDLAPAVVHADPHRGALLSEYLPGRAWDAAALADGARLAALAGLLRRVHALPRCGTRYAGADAARTYFGTLRREGRDDRFARHCLRLATATPGRAPLACCHNDVVAQNVVGACYPRLIDWEYAGDNEPLFDLASLIGWHDLDDARVAVLLDAYAGDDAGGLRARLDAARRRYDAIQWLWLAERTPLAPRLAVIRQRLS